MDIALVTIITFWHTIFACIGVALNGCLVFLAVFKSPKVIQLYSTLIINFAVTDMLACLLDLFIEIRLLPSPNEATMTYILNGYCVYFNVTTCSIGVSLFIHLLTHSLWSLLISFAYRYYALFSPILTRRHIILVIFAFYVPSFVQGATYWTNFVGRDTILPIAKRVYPGYNFNELGGLLMGITDLFSVSALYALLHMTLPVTPVYITIFVLRRKIMTTLWRSHSTMSKETKSVHKQLLEALTCQAIIPVAAWAAVYVYLGMQFGIIKGVFFEYLIFSIVIFMPVLSPITYLVYVRPYRVFCLRKVCRKSEFIANRSQTRLNTHTEISNANRMFRRY